MEKTSGNGPSRSIGSENMGRENTAMADVPVPTSCSFSQSLNFMKLSSKCA